MWRSRSRRHSTLSRAALAALWIVLLSSACANAPPDVVIIVVDTLRRDRVDVFGVERRLMPGLDALAERSTVFHNAYSTSAWTSPAVASLFTSRHPSQHGIRLFGSILAAQERTLVEALRERGYVTAGFSGNWLIRGPLGYGQGFDHFEAQRGQGSGFGAVSERAIETGRRALTWLASRPADSGAPVFLYLHLMNPHTPYHPPRTSLRKVFGADAQPDLEAANEVALADPDVAPDMRELLEGLYDAEVNSLDRDLGIILTVLERGRLADALVVVVADHGEEFWDHGMQGHGRTLFDELVRIPLLVHAPGQTERLDVHVPVSLIDLAPTVLEGVGAAPPSSFRGRSLWPYLTGNGDRLEALPVVSELLWPQLFRRGPHERAVMIGERKLIVDLDGTRHYFDRSTDPEERDSATLPESQQRQLDEALDRFLAEIGVPFEAEVAPLDDDTREELRALGYLE